MVKVLLTVIYIIVMGQVGFFFGLSLPRDLFDENKFPYRLFDGEKNGTFYERLKVKKWKSRVPDMSTLTKRIFPKRIQGGITSKDVDRLVKESCVAELVHYIMCFFAIGIYNIWQGNMGVILAILYALGNLPYAMIQRYNRPHFIALRDKLKKREGRLENA